VRDISGANQESRKPLDISTPVDLFNISRDSRQHSELQRYAYSAGSKGVSEHPIRRLPLARDVHIIGRLPNRANHKMEAQKMAKKLKKAKKLEATKPLKVGFRGSRG
jgi:hypothetical protein